MKKLMILFTFYSQLLLAQGAPQVRTANGVLEGSYESGLLVFKGVPFAQPPIGKFRWREPQPMTNWTGIRNAQKFGPRPMQRNIFGDMVFRSDSMSEDCLYLNIWSPSKTRKENLAVLVYFYGGGFMCGDGSEPRYDGEALARQGIITVTVNYRLNVFGFLAHPELTKESPHHALGNYGLLDQAAALKWLSENISAFGGDPKKITIAGESAGSVSVSAQMVSPLSKNLFRGAIGSSGSILGTLSAISLAEGEKRGLRFAELASAKSLEELRALTADQILAAATNHEFELFAPVVDGYFFPESPESIFAKGNQAHVPLLIGWNSLEGSYRSILGSQAPTPENLLAAVEKLYPSNGRQLIRLYRGDHPSRILQAATDLAGDRFTGFSSWKLGQVQALAAVPVYRYYFTRARPALRGEKNNKSIPANEPTGAVHSADIEYAMGNLPLNTVFDWQPGDYRASGFFQRFYLNFVRTGNPNGLGLPDWKPLGKSDETSVMSIDDVTVEHPDIRNSRYRLLDKLR